MKTLNARFDWGRWIVDCPDRCGGARLVAHCEDGEFICAEKYPEITAATIGAAGLVPDLDARAAAKALAETNNDVYQIVLPENKEQIEAALRMRNIENMHWFPGETVEDLLYENGEHGVQS